MEYLSGDSEFRHLENSAIVNDFGETMTTYKDNTLPFNGNYSNLGGIRRLVRRKDARREQRVDARQGAKEAKKLGTAEKRSGKAASLRSDGTLASAVLASTQSAPSGARKAPATDNKKKILIGLGIVAAIGITIFLIKKK